MRFGSFVGNMGESLGRDAEGDDDDLAWQQDLGMDTHSQDMPSTEVFSVPPEGEHAFMGNTQDKGLNGRPGHAGDSFVL